MDIEFLDSEFTIVKVEDYSEIDLNNLYTFIATTENEKSVMLQTKYTPSNFIAKEDDFICFRLVGTFEFSLIGIASKITTILKDNGISVLVISTFDTDYFFINVSEKDKAVNGLRESGYRVIE